MSDNPPNPLQGLLSELALGPAWARDKSDTPAKKFQPREDREFAHRSRDNRQTGDRREHNDRGERRQGGGGERRNYDSSRSNVAPRHEEIPPAEGVSVSLLPEKTAIQLIAREIQQVARVYPLFDIAQIILAQRARTRAIFEVEPSKPPFYRCKIEEALFLTKEEALRHLLQSPWRDRFIEESTIEVDPPKGSFQSVARCGISGEWLGPPNFHSYQTNLRRIHRERFANMPFEAYSAKVRTERGEEAVNEWLASMKTQTRWRIRSEEKLQEAKAIGPDEKATPVPDAEPVPADHTIEISKTEPLSDSQPQLSEMAPTEPNSIISEESVAEDLPPITTDSGEPTLERNEDDPGSHSEDPKPVKNEPDDEDSPWYTDRSEVERIIAAEVLEKVFHVTRKAKVSSAISAKNLSAALLTRLKFTGNHIRKHPAIMIPTICRVLEEEHMPVFKRKGKLFTGPARPHSLAADAVLAARPASMVKWIRENPPAKLEGLWAAILPEGSTAPPQEFAADLFWLLQQGHILLYTDDVLVVQEPREIPEPKKPKKQAASKSVPGEKSVDATAEPTAITGQPADVELAEPSTEEPIAAIELSAPANPEPIESSDEMSTPCVNSDQPHETAPTHDDVPVSTLAEPKEAHIP
ncbi:MAG: hypothetical protein H7Y36_02685 [Armatimonadetes bacterium]|nr:hypothetical protein [Akkermansiaceae bacterium]